MMAKVLLEGLDFGEGPRWRDGKLWFSDFYRGAVFTVDLEGNETRVVDVPSQPSGLGWTPDGRLMIVSMLDRKVLVMGEDGSLTEHADLGEVATFHTNDMLVGPDGGAYVGNFGFDLHDMLEKHEVPEAVGIIHSDPAKYVAMIARVDPDGTVRPTGDPMLFPNGMVFMDDGKTVVASETVAFRLQAYTVADDGSLTDARTWADLQEAQAAPDGMCNGPGGTVFVAPALYPQVLQVAHGGEIVARHDFSQNVYAVASSGTHLFAMTAPSSEPRHVQGKRLGKIEVAEL